MLVRGRETRFDQPSEIYLAMQPFYGAASPPLIIGGILGPMGVGNAPAVVFLLLALSAVELEFHSMKLLPVDIFLPRVRNGNSEFRNLPEQEKKILYINSTIQM